MTRAADLPVGWKGLAFDEIDSTNSEALRRAGSGERGPLWITARRQTQGRGRSGRVWASADASLAATLLLAPSCAVAALPQLALVAGVAASDAVLAMLPQDARCRVRLKWPNDVLVGGAKVTGILIESSIFGSELVAVIGIGTNVGARPDLGRSDVTSLADNGSTAGAGELSRTLAHALAHWLAVWREGGGLSEIRDAWLARAGRVGEPMTVNAGGEKVAGVFAGLDEDGALLLETGGALRRFTFGDVALGATRV
ncbi:MAG: biotin--[acetyl-CoA-carboxylase] ligase [Hyphomicrobiaceae bacterium]